MGRRLYCALSMNSFLAGLGRVAIDALLIAAQQICQRMLVMDVCGGDHRTADQPALAVHTDVQLHSKVPMLALAGLVHLMVMGFMRVLGGAGCANYGGIHNSVYVNLKTTTLQFLTDLGK